MQHRVRTEILAQPAIIGAESVGWGKAAIEQQPHRIAIIAETGLDTDEDVAKALSENADRRPIGKLAAGGGAPLRFDLAQMRLAADVIVGGDERVNVGIRAVAIGVAAQHRIAQRIDRIRELDGVSVGVKSQQCRVQRLEHAKEGSGAGRPGVGREVEERDRNSAIGTRCLAQRDQLRHARCQRFGPLGACDHRAAERAFREYAAAAAPGAGGVRAIRATAEHHRRGSTVYFGDRDHHRRLDRRQTLRSRTPMLNGLKFKRVGGEIRTIELRQNLFGRFRIAVGGAADEREAGQRNQRIDSRLAVFHEEGFDRRSLIEPAGKGRNDAQAFRLQRGDRAVIMAGVASENVRAQQQQPDRADGLGRGGEDVSGGRHARLERRVIDADLGIFGRQLCRHGPAQFAPIALGVAIDQRSDHLDEIIV